MKNKKVKKPFLLISSEMEMAIAHNALYEILNRYEIKVIGYIRKSFDSELEKYHKLYAVVLYASDNKKYIPIELKYYFDREGLEDLEKDSDFWQKRFWKDIEHVAKNGSYW